MLEIPDTFTQASQSIGMQGCNAFVNEVRSPILVLQLLAERSNDGREVNLDGSIQQPGRSGSRESTRTGDGDADDQSDHAGQEPGDGRS